MSSPIVTLGGVAARALGPVGWTFTRGVEPGQRVFELPRDVADAVLAQPVVTLAIEDGRGQTLQVSGLYVLQTFATDHPQTVGVLVSDLRWLWGRVAISKGYNVRKRSGTTRLIRSGGSLLVDQARGQITSDVIYALWSLKDDSTPWTVREVFVDVLRAVVAPASVDLSRATFPGGDAVYENLEIVTDGASALSQVLGYFPWLELWVDGQGVVHVEDRAGGAEARALQEAGRPLVGSTLAQETDLRRVRPSRVDVYFVPEDELRFDYREGSTGTTSEDARSLRNVMPLPDPSLTINGDSLTQGSWVEINSALLSAWHADNAPSVIDERTGGARALPEVTLDVVQRLWASGGYNLLYEATAVQSDQLWQRRWNALLAHYRQTFQPNRRWVDRLRSIRGDRVAIVDPENGVRAPAEVFAPYTLIPTARRAALAALSQRRQYAVAAGAWAAALADAQLAQAVVQILDPEQGVFHVTFRGDPYGETASVWPSAVTVQSNLGIPAIPVADARGITGVKQWLAVTIGAARLTTTHDLAVVLTGATAAPNSLARLYRVSVTPDEAKSLLPSSVASKIGACSGPPLAVIVGAGTSTARFAWEDDAASEIEGVILDGVGERSDRRCVNLDEVRAVAKAAAARVYSSLADRLEGQVSSTFAPGVTPAGRISRVAHELAPNGTFTTSALMPPEVQGLDLYSLLPASVRRTILRQVQP